MPSLRFVALGVGDAFSALYYSTSLAVVADGGWLLVDCPHPIFKIVREASLSSGVRLDVTDLAGVALTHLHADHASGLEGLGAFRKKNGLDPLPLFAGTQVIDLLQTRSIARYFELRLVGEGAAAAEEGPFRLEARPAKHGTTPAYAIRIYAGGRCLAHSGDTSFDEALIEWLCAADLAVHEAGIEAGESHTGYDQLARLPEGQRRKLRLAHYGDSFDFAWSVIEPLRQGRVYEC